MRIFQHNLSKIVALRFIENMAVRLICDLQLKKMLLVLPKARDVGTKICLCGIYHNVQPIRMLQLYSKSPE